MDAGGAGGNAREVAAITASGGRSDQHPTPEPTAGGRNMSASGLASIDHAPQVAAEWINDLSAALGWPCPSSNDLEQAV